MALDRNVTLARAQQAHVEMLDGKDPISDDPRVRTGSRHHPDLRRPQSPPHVARRGSAARPLDRLIRDAEGIDVRVFPQ